MSNSNSNEPGVVREPGAPLKRRRSNREPNQQPNLDVNNNQPGAAPRRRLFRPRAAFLEDDESTYRERAIQRILNSGQIGDEVEGMYQAQGLTHIYRISGPTEENPSRHLVQIARINDRFGGKRRKTQRRKTQKRKTQKRKTQRR